MSSTTLQQASNWIVSRTGSPTRGRAVFAALVAVVVWATGCADAPPPMISNVEAIQSTRSVLVYELAFRTDIDAQATVEVRPDGAEPWLVPVTTELGTDHAVPILGLRPETTYTFHIVATGELGGTAEAESDPITTAALPADLDALRTEVIDGDAVAPGYTLFGLRRWTPAVDAEWGYLIAVDAAGEVVWYLDVGHPSADLRQRPNGHLLYSYANTMLREITASGEQVWERNAPELGTDTFHHENFLAEDGSIVLLSTELRAVSGYPGDVTLDVVGDVVVRLSSDGSAIEHQHSILDILDPLRTRPGFDTPFWNQQYAAESSSTKDWTHGNAVIVDPADGNYIVSLRHQDWLIKMDATTGALIWRLGEEGDFTMDGEGEWAFHTHAPEIQPDGNLLLFDNGNARTTLAAGELPYTRVVEYDLDETAMTAREVWSYHGLETYHAPFVGDADRLSNGNVLITDGGLILGCPSADPATCVPFTAENQKWARIVEVTHTDAPEEVLRITVRDDATTDPVGYTIYRAERIESLYGDAP